jgi:hypothetical protein
MHKKKYLFAVLPVISISLLLLSMPAKALSNDPSGDIFIAKSFGDFSNCGPISALMLAKYINHDFSEGDLNTAIIKARKITMKDKSANVDYRWWNMRDIKKYLHYMSVKYDEVLMHNDQPIEKRRNEIVSRLDQGSVVLINVNMNDLPQDSEVGKAWGHFLIIVGYKEINGRMAFEIHDSYTQSGKNRLFFADNIVNSIHSYNPEVIFVKNTKTMDNLWASADW